MLQLQIVFLFYKLEENISKNKSHGRCRVRILPINSRFNAVTMSLLQQANGKSIADFSTCSKLSTSFKLSKSAKITRSNRSLKVISIVITGTNVEIVVIRCASCSR